MTPHPGWSEQDPEDWLHASERALARLGVDTPRIGLSGQMHGLVCLDEHDRVLRPAILWNDQRTGIECTEIEERVGLERLISLTGNRALPGFTAPKLLWLRRHEPDVYSRIRRIVLPKDYVRLRLTGEWAIDAADASGTLLFDVAAPALERRGARRARHPARVAPTRERVDRDRRRGRPAGRRPRGRGHRAGHCLCRPRHLGCRARRASGVLSRFPGTSPCVLPCRSRDLGGDGCDAQCRGLTALAPRRARTGNVIRRAHSRSERAGILASRA